MNKFKLLFLFIFVLNIFSASFCMESEQDGNGRKRGRQQMETLEDQKDVNASKKRKEDACDSSIESMEKEASDSTKEQEALEDNEFWDDLFSEKLETIEQVVLGLKKDFDFDEDNDFYDAFKNFGSKNKHEKCVEVLRLFLDKDLDWLRLFNIVLYDKNKQALLLLKNKIVNKEENIDKIDEFSYTDIFPQDEITFFPGIQDFETTGYFRQFSPLFIAVCLQDLDLVKIIVKEFGADVNAAQVAPENYDGPEIYTGMTPLQVAIILGNNNVIDYLLYSEAVLNVDMVQYLFSENLINPEYKDKLGRTLLHIACERCNIDMAEYLINLGVGLQVKDNRGAKPTGLAIGHDFEEFFSYVFDSKIFDQEIKGKYFLRLAICSNRIKMVKYFIEKRGIDLNFVDKNGNNWLNIACGANSYDVALYLVKKFIEKI
jgi:Ankyrin repeat.